MACMKGPLSLTATPSFSSRPLHPPATVTQPSSLLGQVFCCVSPTSRGGKGLEETFPGRLSQAGQGSHSRSGRGRDERDIPPFLKRSPSFLSRIPEDDGFLSRQRFKQKGATPSSASLGANRRETCLKRMWRSFGTTLVFPGTPRH